MAAHDLLFVLTHGFLFLPGLSQAQKNTNIGRHAAFDSGEQAKVLFQIIKPGTCRVSLDAFLLPDALADRKYYVPTRQGRESRIVERMEQIEAWQKQHRKK